MGRLCSLPRTSLKLFEIVGLVKSIDKWRFRENFENDVSYLRFGKRAVDGRNNDELYSHAAGIDKNVVH